MAAQLIIYFTLWSRRRHSSQKKKKKRFTTPRKVSSFTNTVWTCWTDINTWISWEMWEKILKPISFKTVKFPELCPIYMYVCSNGKRKFRHPQARKCRSRKFINFYWYSYLLVWHNTTLSLYHTYIYGKVFFFLLS